MSEASAFGHEIPGMAWARGWAVAIASLSIVALVAVVLDVAAPVRPLLTIAFVVVCPGMALVRLLRLGGPLTETMLAIAISLSLAGIVAGALLYAGAWSPTATFLILIAIAWTGLVLDPALPPRRRWLGEVRAGFAGATSHRAEAATASARPAASSAGREVLPPPPVAVVRRRPSAPQPAPKASGGRRTVLGSDPFDDEGSGRALRTTIEQVVDELADEREGRRS